MSWETRGGGRYFYSVTRCGGRLRNRYFGRGELAEMAAGVVDAARRKREEERKACERHLEQLGGPEAAEAALSAACDTLLAMELTLAGYHRPGYRKWRRRPHGRVDGRTARHSARVD